MSNARKSIINTKISYNRICDERSSRQYKIEITYVRVQPECVPRGGRSSNLVSAAADTVGTRNWRLSLSLPYRVRRLSKGATRQPVLCASLFTNTRLPLSATLEVSWRCLVEKPSAGAVTLALRRHRRMCLCIAIISSYIDMFYYYILELLCERNLNRWDVFLQYRRI